MTATGERCSDLTNSPRGELRCVLPAGHGGIHWVDPAGPVEAPSEPEFQPCDVAIATVRANRNVHLGQLVMRCEAPDRPWLSAVCLDGYGHKEHNVTVTSRAVVVTEQDRDELIETLRSWPHGPRAARQAYEFFAKRGLGGES